MGVVNFFPRFVGLPWGIHEKTDQICWWEFCHGLVLLLQTLQIPFVCVTRTNNFMSLSEGWNNGNFSDWISQQIINTLLLQKLKARNFTRKKGPIFAQMSVDILLSVLKWGIAWQDECKFFPRHIMKGREPEKQLPVWFFMLKFRIFFKETLSADTCRVQNSETLSKSHAIWQRVPISTAH